MAGARKAEDSGMAAYEAPAGARRLSGQGFSRLRALLGKSQRELALLLGISIKAVESYEQGWRKVPAHVERLLYFILFKLRATGIEAAEPCWTIMSCSDARRDKCVAFVAKEGRFCWFFTGRLCAAANAEGASDRDCYACAVFSRMFERVNGRGT